MQGGRFDLDQEKRLLGHRTEFDLDQVQELHGFRSACLFLWVDPISMGVECESPGEVVAGHHRSEGQATVLRCLTLCTRSLFTWYDPHLL